MKILDDIYCGIQHDIPTAKECRRALKKGSTRGWKSEGIGYGSGVNFVQKEIDLYTSSEEFDEEELGLVDEIRGSSSNWESS